MVVPLATGGLVVALRHNNQVILPLELRWNPVVVHGTSSSLLLALIIPQIALSNHHLTRLLVIKPSLLHNNIESGELLLINLLRGQWQARINDRGEQLDVALRVRAHAVDESLVLVGAEELSQVVQFERDERELFVYDILEHGHVLEVAVDWIVVITGHAWVTKGSDEIGAPLHFTIVVGHVYVSVYL